VKLFTFCGTRKFTLHLALGGAFRGAIEPGYKCENIIDFFNYNLEGFFFVCNHVFGVHYFKSQELNTCCVL